jgi:hypothetical protein
MAGYLQIFFLNLFRLFNKSSSLNNCFLEICEDTANWTDSSEFGFGCADYKDNGWCDNCTEGLNWDYILWDNLTSWGVEENCCLSCGCDCNNFLFCFV